MILFDERSLRRAIEEFLVGYHFERNHQGLNNELILPRPAEVDLEAPIKRRQRLGCILPSTTGKPPKSRQQILTAVAKHRLCILSRPALILHAPCRCPEDLAVQEWFLLAHNSSPQKPTASALPAVG